MTASVPLRESYKNGASVGIRTPDPRLRRALLYPTELKTHIIKENGAEDEIRTRDIHLGKAMLYH